MKELVSCEDRLKSMIITNKQETPQRINKLLKSELLFVMKNYFDITAEDLNLNINVNEFGKFSISMEAEARSMRIAHIFGNSV